MEQRKDYLLILKSSKERYIGTDRSVVGDNGYGETIYHLRTNKGGLIVASSWDKYDFSQTVPEIDIDSHQPNKLEDPSKIRPFIMLGFDEARKQ